MNDLLPERFGNTQQYALVLGRNFAFRIKALVLINDRGILNLVTR
ncbi:hypothetical protein [Marinobacterium stanieri]